jgi:hypothetical protein
LVVGLSLPLTFVGLCAYAQPSVGLTLAAIPVGIFAAARAAGALWMWSLDRLNRRRLRKLLAETLARAGVGEEDGERRKQIERDFWHEQQRAALVALRGRFAQDPEPLDLLDALLARGSTNSASLKGAVAVSALICIGAGALGASYDAGLLFGVGAGLFLSVQILGLALLLLVWESFATQRSSRSDRQEFVRESRRIATMAELAGGLSLAEHEIDEALRGALSDDVAQPGALSEIERGMDA